MLLLPRDKTLQPNQAQKPNAVFLQGVQSTELSFARNTNIQERVAAHTLRRTDKLDTVPTRIHFLIAVHVTPVCSFPVQLGSCFLSLFSSQFCHIQFQNRHHRHHTKQKYAFVPLLASHQRGQSSCLLGSTSCLFFSFIESQNLWCKFHLCSKTTPLTDSKNKDRPGLFYDPNECRYVQRTDVETATTPPKVGFVLPNFSCVLSFFRLEALPSKCKAIATQDVLFTKLLSLKVRPETRRVQRCARPGETFFNKNFCFVENFLRPRHQCTTV